ncbi:putative serine-rich protein C1E8.05 [Senna tora]|uniref:Putative serine-rich protein C1E8.05 n=1 Tax=Senna tora TaxID=362788 RepID=A0A834TK63_9FABA|nr:putative serine-rich protein C1E8.05 [Senna tora]
MPLSPFPSSEERTVASALLLLRAVPPSFTSSLSPPRFDSDRDDSVPERSRNKSCGDSFLSSDSKASSSSLVNDSGSHEQIRGRRIRFFSAVARYRQMKFKVMCTLKLFELSKIVRKSRSKIIWASSDDVPKPNTAMASTKVSTCTAEASSCLSSSSSAISSARSLRYINRARRGKMLGMVKRNQAPHANKKHVVDSAYMRRRAEAIVKLLSGGESSEVRIRQLLGDSPDTSKALRM